MKKRTEKNKKKRESDEYVNKGLPSELWEFLRVRKLWWMTPIIVMLILVGLLIIFGQSSAVSPFVYALF